MYLSKSSARSAGCSAGFKYLASLISVATARGTLPRLEAALAVVNTYALRNKTPQARAEYCRLPSAPARYTLGQTAEDAAAEELKLRVRLYGRDLYASHLD
jgi:hypothetical protein